MDIITDPITNQLENYFHSNGDNIISVAINEGFIEKFLTTSNAGVNSDEKSKRTKEFTDYLDSLIQDICRGHVRWKLIILFRKLPNISYEFLEKIFSDQASSRSIKPIFIESIIFGTNSILKYAVNDHSLTHCNDRYNFTAREDELEDTIKLMVYCIFHRYLMYYLNAISHGNIQDDPSVPELMQIYNYRQEKRKLPRRIDTTYQAIFSPVFMRHIPEKERGLVYQNHSGETVKVIIKNYLPYPVSQDDEFEKYSILNCSEFKVLTGLSFDNWWKIWLSLNQVIKNNIIFLWSDEETYSTFAIEMRASAERADDYSDTAMGCGVISSITETCYGLLEKEYKESAPSLKECNTFFNFLCCDQLRGDPRFVEQPYLFYNIGPDRVYWDYFRHSGMMRAVMRKLFSTPGKVAGRLINHAASKFEERIQRRIEKYITEANTFKLNVKIKNELNGQVAWQIDTGFIFRNILFLVEVKNWFKPEKYYLAYDPALSSRISEFESVLHKQDENLEKYKRLVAQRWGAKVAGAICVVCTEGVEFTALLDPKFWLKTGEIPRICLVDELIDFLNSENVEELKNHPNFVRFDI